MKAQPTRVPEVLLLTPQVFGDARGLFFEAWNARDYGDAGLPNDWVQDNLSRSQHGVLRGLHCQVQQLQAKLVRCVHGAIFDVAVDLRALSPTFGKWCGHVLDDATWHAMWIPPGFAHGYYVLSNLATVHYKASDFYAPTHERILRWDDPDVGIEWPLVNGASPTLSERDQHGASLADARRWFA